MKPRVQEVHVFQEGFARVASDHYPVYVRIKTDK
jgi:endonuclease/exonuclease/phosphatase family metal-dependent hydrolase